MGYYLGIDGGGSKTTCAVGDDANLLATATEGADAELVAAGWLHDAIEDTETTREELAEKFSDRVASLVVECTDDMRLPKAERRRLQVVDAPKKSPGAKLIKIADKLPVNLLVGAYYNALRPSGTCTWQLRTQITLVF